MTKKKKTTKKIKPQHDPLDGINEEEFLNIVKIITKKLAYKFKFGYHDIEDMQQQITIFAIEGLKNYDHVRPLENFLWTHVRNRLFNYKRDNYQRPNKPCLICPLYDPHLKQSSNGCTKYNHKDDCELYNKWSNRNNSKKNLMHLTTIEEIKDYGSVFYTPQIPESLIDSNEILENIECKLHGELREIYLKIKNGCKVNKVDSDKLLSYIKQNILQDNNEDNDE